MYEIARNRTGLLDGRKPVSTEAEARQIAATLARQHGEAFQVWDERKLIDVIDAAPTYAKFARVSAWGATKGARRVSGLTPDERQAIRSGSEVRIAGCPMYQGQTDRRIVEICGRFSPGFRRIVRDEREYGSP